MIFAETAREAGAEKLARSTKKFRELSKYRFTVNFANDPMRFSLKSKKAVALRSTKSLSAVGEEEPCLC